jgi:hypothetical protein
MQEPISLYLDLPSGEKPDLEIVALASIALVSAVKEAAYILDPGMEVTLDFASGTEGSLSLNTIIKNIKKSAADPATLKAIGLIVLTWFANDIRTYGVAKFLDHYLPNEQRQTISDADLARITDALQKAMDGKIARAPVQQVYRELERDTTIKGVGASLIPGQRPPNIVPRDQFMERSGVAQTIEKPQSKKRTKTTRERLTLISPVLLPKDRRWKFYLPQIGEFGAKIKDDKFLASLLSGKRRIPMRAGIQIEAELAHIMQHRLADVV